MPDPAKPHVIAIEEHYADPAVTARADGAPRQAELTARLNDLGQLRLGEMDAAGIGGRGISEQRLALRMLVG